MVETRIEDGHRIAQLLASEITGRETGPLAEMAVVDADPDVTPTADGAFAYGIDHDGDRLADCYVQPNRAYLEVRRGVDAAADSAAENDLRVRPRAVDPPHALVFVESGAAVKRAVDVLIAAAGAAAESTEE